MRHTPELGRHPADVVASPNGFGFVGAGQLKVAMDPYAAFMFYCNEDYNGFGDNRGFVTIRWNECVTRSSGTGEAEHVGDRALQSSVG